MDAALRPWFTRGVVLVGASAIVLAPVSPMAPSPVALDVRAATVAVARDFQLTALDIPYILTLPIIRQQIRNWAENWAVYLAGFGKAGVGLVQSLVAIPGVTVEAIQQVLALDFVGAFNTVATAVRDAVVAVGQPLLDSLIWRNQKYYLTEAALRAAVPQAFIDVTNGFLQAGNLVTTSLIVGTQDLVAAILTLDLGNIVNAAIDGTKNFFDALGAGAGAIVDGIEAGQLGIATALATPPPAPPTFAVADVSALSALSVDNTITLSRSKAAALDSVDPALDQQTIPDATSPEVVDKTPDPVEVDAVVKVADPLPSDEKAVVADVADTPAKVEPKDASSSPAASAATPASAPSDDADPADPPKKVHRVHPVRNGVRAAEKAAGVDKDAGADTDAGKKDAGADAKPASGSESD